MAVDLRGVTSGTRVATSTTTGTVTFHASLAVGDLMVLFVGDANGTTTWPSGWTLADTSDTGGIVGRTYWKIATSGDVSATSTTYTNSNTVNGGGWVLATFKAGSFDTTTPVALNVEVADGGPTTRTPTVASLSMPLRGYGLYFLHRRTDTVGSPNFGTAQSVTAIPGSGTHGSHALYREGAFAATSRALSWSSGSEYGHYAVTLRVNPAATPSHLLTISSGARTSGTATVTFPTSLAAGDEMVLFIGDGDSWTGPSGWTLQSGGIAGTQFDGAWYRKTATSGDVSATSVTYAGASTNRGGWVLATFASGTTFAFQSATRDGLNASSLPVTVSSASVATGDEALYWIHRRNDTATLTASSGVDTSNITKTLGTNAGEQSLFTEDITSSGTRSIQWTTSNNSDYGYYAVTLVATPSAAAPVSVAAPVLAVTVDALDPTVSAGTGTTVAAPALAVSTALLAPTVSMGSSVNVAAPVLALSLALLAPTVDTISGAATVDAPVLGLSTTLLAPTVTAGAAVTVDAPALALVVAVPTPSVTTAAAVLDSVDVGVGVGPVTLEAGGALSGTDAVNAPVACGVEVVARFLPKPVAPPLGVLTEWPLQRQAHIMPALTAGAPRYRADIDYTVDREEAGRRHVFVNGVDVTYIRDVPVAFDDHSSSVPFDARTCRVALPQKKPWDEMGEGDFAMFDPTNDPAVEIVLVRPDDSIEELWEGFLAAEDDGTGPGQQDFTFSGEGLFSQAAHQPHNPRVFMDPTDIGHLVADALNSVVGRRWHAIPRVTTGILTRNRGTQGQSVWQYVQDLLSKAWTDDERQWTLVRVAAYTYRIQLKTVVTETDWTVTKGAPGVEVNVTRDQAARRDCIFGRGIDPDGGVWGNWYFPGLDKFNLPPYPMAGFANMSVGTADSDTTTGHGVTDWQRRMREIGFPVTVDGVMNSSDTDWVKKVQRLRGITVDGSLGPQTWAATFDPGVTELDLTAVRLPLAAKPDSEPYLYSANGSQQGANPLFNSLRVRHAMTEVDFGPGVWKHEAFGLAEKMLARDGVVGWSGTITLLTDPHEAGASRFQIRPGHNVHVVGHAGGVDLQVSEVSVSGLSVTLTVDSRARDALTVDAILERNREARRDPSSRTGSTSERSSLNRSDVVQYESESQAGTVPRVAVNGNSGLWTILPIFVSQVGVAKVEFYATEPKAEMCIALFGRPITANKLASFLPDPLADDSGWYDNVDTLETKFALMEIWGSSGNPAGYWPKQKVGNPVGPLTGKMKERSGALYDSPFGGFVWVAMFTSRSTWVHGRVFPAVPQ